MERVRQLDPAEPVRGFLQVPPDEEPGTVFAYNNTATYVVGAIVQRLTGETLTSYLRPRLFEPLGIDQAYWDGDRTGRELGFTGLHLTTGAVARFGQLYLDDGVWQGARLLPAGWVAEATALHTPNPGEPHPDWQQGYGYQFWQIPARLSRGRGVRPVLPGAARAGRRGGHHRGDREHAGNPGRGLGRAAARFRRPGSAADDYRLSARLAALALPVLDPVGQADWADASGLEAHESRPSPWPTTTAAVGPSPWSKAGSGWWFAAAIRSGPGPRCRSGTTAGSRSRPAVCGPTASTFSAELIFVQTPHRLRIRFEPDSGRSAAQWVTGPPLRSPTMRGLATPVDLVRRG